MWSMVNLKEPFAVILAVAVMVSGFSAFASVQIVEQVEEPLEVLKLDEELPEAIEVSAVTADLLPARSAILLDQQQGAVIFEKNADEPLPPASLTKVMTLLLAMEALESGRINLEDMVSASEYACSMGGSQIWLKPGEQMSVNDLLKAVAISSANDASVAIGEFISGTNEAFVDMMNMRAQQLGMENTHFLNCNGLDEPGHLTTARDIAIMSRELMKHERIRDYSTVWMDSLRDGATELVNTNRLVRFYGGSTGLKTGTTNGAGSCLSATAERDGLGLVAVVMGSATSDDRFASARSLLDYGFANYVSVSVPPIDGQLTPVTVLRGVEDKVAVTYNSPGNLVVNKSDKENIEQSLTMMPDAEAPVLVGQVLGKAEVLVGGKVVCSYDIKAAMSIDRINIASAYHKLLRSLLKISEPPAENEIADQDLPESAPDTVSEAG